MQKLSQNQTGGRESAPTSGEKQIVTIQLSSDDEPVVAATTTTTSKAISNISADNSSSAAAQEQTECSRTRSRSRSLSHGSSSSSLSSTISSSYRSVDYEAEADEEDANECEGVELQRKLAGGNDNLMHVQNFLNCFDTPQQGRHKQKVTTQPEEQQQQQQQQMLQKQDKNEHGMGKHYPSEEIIRFEPLTFVDLSPMNKLTTHNHNEAISIATAVAEANTTEEIPTTSSAVTTKASSKPGKFTISTKFLRKPRHKLKSVNIAPIADVSNAMTATKAHMGNEEMRELQESQVKHQHISQQQQRQPTQVDEPNVKFNSNFSINSLLNKR